MLRQHWKSIKLGVYNMKTTSSLSCKLKDTTHDWECLIRHKIHCGDCDKYYVGHTEQYLHNRVRQHKYGTENNCLKKIIRDMILVKINKTVNLRFN